MRQGLLVKYGEIAIRGRNRYLFENKLIDAIKKNISENHGYIVKKEQGRLLIENKNSDMDYDTIIPKVIVVMGVVGVSPCIITQNQDLDNIKVTALEHINNQYEKDSNYTFKIETKRGNKNYPMTSQQISAEIGGYLLENTNNLKVDVVSPDIKVFVELRNNVYIYSKTIKGYGGLPVGSSGKALLLLSGGIDSPVAGFLMEKRGVEIEAVYFHSAPYTSERAKEKVIDLAKQIGVFTGSIKLHIIHFTDIQLMIYDMVPEEKITIFLKRAMIKVADKIAKEIDAQALVLGDSIGQVASQTMHSIKAVESATSLPIIRPLAGFDKQEIINIARKINTYNISILPYEDCCTIFVAKHPETKPKTSIIENIESKMLELDKLIDNAINNIETIKI